MAPPASRPLSVFNVPQDVQQKRLELLAADLLSTGLPPSARVQPEAKVVHTAPTAGGAAPATGDAAPFPSTAGAAPAGPRVLEPTAQTTSCCLGTTTVTTDAATGQPIARPPGQLPTVGDPPLSADAPPSADAHEEAKRKIAALRQQLINCGFEPCV
jgi:hypothetical protein